MAALLLLYCAVWVRFWRRDCLFRAVALSVLPSVLFLCQGVLMRNFPRAAPALVFAPCHILISVKNAAHRRAHLKNDV